MEKAKKSIINVLQAITGLPRDETDKIWAEAKANYARLEACVGPHEFVLREEAGENRTLWKTVCTKCGGSVDQIHARWYNDGLKHGKALR